MLTKLSGLRILVVEDDDLIATLIAEWLADQQCAVVGPFSKLSAALEAARTAVVDIALLDVNLGSDRSYPVAEVLHNRGKPFLFLSGEGEEAAPADRPEWRVCSKPFHMQDLMNMMLEILG